MKLFHLVALCTAVFILAPAGYAAEPAITVYGPGDSTPVSLSEEKVRAIASTQFSTFDPWDNKKRTYKGCSLVALLEKIGKSGKFQTIEAVAKNDYKARITAAELQKYPYILSYEMDGKDYSEYGDENKGPLAIAVKMEEVDESDRARVKNQLVWWIEKLVLR